MCARVCVCIYIYIYIYICQSTDTRHQIHKMKEGSVLNICDIWNDIIYKYINREIFLVLYAPNAYNLVMKQKQSRKHDLMALLWLSTDPFFSLQL